MKHGKHHHLINGNVTLLWEEDKKKGNLYYKEYRLKFKINSSLSNLINKNQQLPSWILLSFLALMQMN